MELVSEKARRAGGGGRTSGLAMTNPLRESPN